MKLKEMLAELLLFYPLKGRSEDEIYRIIDRYNELILGETYKTNKNYDWDLLLKKIQLNKQYQTFPTIQEIIKYLPECIKRRECGEGDSDGCLIVVKLKDGRCFTYEAYNNHEKTISTGIKNRFGDKLESIYQYPKGTVMVGGKIFYPEGMAGMEKRIR